MKGVNKCYGLLLVLATIFGLSLSVSSDTSALKYSYDAFPLVQSSLVPGSSGSNSTSYDSSTFSISFGDSLSFDSDKLNRGSHVGGLYNAGSCNSTSSLSNFIVSSSNGRVSLFSGSSTVYYNRFSLINPPLGSSFLSLSSRQLCQNDKFETDFDAVPASSINMSTGDIDKYVDIPSNYLSGTFPSGELYSINVPLDLDYSKLGTISSGTPLDWTFVLFSSNPFSNFNSSTSASLSLSYYTSDFSSYNGSTADFSATRFSTSVSCSIDSNFEFLRVYDDLTFVHNYGLKVDCSFTPSTPMSYVFASLSISASNSPILSFSNDLFFGSTYIVTFRDDTWSGVIANKPLEGNNIQLSPGYSSLYCDNTAGCFPSDGDYSSSLTNLFNFNFINPFAPIFQLFSNNESCASIPTLAGMLHSEETEVCPWFDSTTRGIVTPVLGLSSMMLVFGFAVRWLGARSGNLFEDSLPDEDIAHTKGITTDNYHFANKYRSRK